MISVVTENTDLLRVRFHCDIPGAGIGTGTRYDTNYRYIKGKSIVLFMICGTSPHTGVWLFISNISEIYSAEFIKIKLLKAGSIFKNIVKILYQR